MKVLVIDDDFVGRVLLQDILTQYGYDVITALDGTEGLRKAREERPSVVITDVLMPGMDGYQFLREIRRDSTLRDMPVIFYTGTYLDRRDEELASDLGVTRFLTKPRNPQEIVNAVKEAIEEGASAPSGQPVIEEPVFLRLYNERLVSKLKSKVEESERTRLFLDSVMESIGDGLVVIDRSHNILHANSSASATIGLEKSEIIGKKCYETIHRNTSPCEGADITCPMHEVFEKGRTSHVIHTHTDASGNEQYIDITASPIKDADGKIIAMVETYRNFMQRQTDDELINLVKKLNEAQVRLKQMAITDDLTGLRNRRYIMERLEEEFQRAKRSGRPLSLVMLDIDHFKDINDTHGHLFGDTVLKIIASRIRDCLRRNDIVGRVGGEEFLVISPDSGVEEAVLVAERIRRVVHSKAIGDGDIEVSVTLSAGVATAGREDRSADRVFSRADTALYKAKQEGRNRVKVIKP